MARRKTKAKRPQVAVGKTVGWSAPKCQCHKTSPISKAKAGRAAAHKGKAAAVKKAKQAAAKKPCRC